MAEYIEKEALKNRIRTYNCTSTSDNVDYNRGLNDALHYVVPMIIAEQPAVNVAPVVHGRWEAIYYTRIHNGATSFEGFMCSVCKKMKSSKFDFCPNCGARMDGE